MRIVLCPSAFNVSLPSRPNFVNFASAAVNILHSPFDISSPAGVAELVDAQDLKSCVLQRAYGFESHPRHKRFVIAQLVGSPGR